MLIPRMLADVGERGARVRARNCITLGFIFSEIVNEKVQASPWCGVPIVFTSRRVAPPKTHGVHSDFYLNVG